MMPWRHSATWRAFTCWRCWFVKIERVDDETDEAIDLSARDNERRRAES
jgi:hypothetical protein